MPDWGGIGAANAAAGFLSGFAQEYSRSNYERQQRAAHQENMLLNFFTQSAIKNPTLLTNPGFLNAIPASGLSPEASGVLTTVFQGLASDPTIQQQAQNEENMAKLQSSFTGPVTPQEVGSTLRGLAVPTTQPGVSAPPQSVFNLGQQPGGAEALQAATDQPQALERRIRERPTAAALAFPKLAPTIAAMQKAKGAGGKPTISYHQIRQGDKIITRRTVTNPDGTIEESDVGSGNAYQGRKIRTLTDKEITTFDQGNSIVQQIDDLEQRMQADPSLKGLIGSSGTVLRELGGELMPTQTLKQWAQTRGLTQEQADFISDAARLVNKDIQDFAGKQVTGYEGTRVLKQAASVLTNPEQFVGRLRQMRRYVIRAVGNKARALHDSKVVEAVPQIYESRLDRNAARLAREANKYAKAFLAPAAGAGSAPPAGGGTTYEPGSDEYLNQLMNQ